MNRNESIHEGEGFEKRPAQYYSINLKGFVEICLSLVSKTLSENSLKIVTYHLFGDKVYR